MSKAIILRELATAPTGLYHLELWPGKYLPVSRFVNITEKTPQLRLQFAVNREKVTGLCFSTECGELLPDLERACLANFMAKARHTVKSRELYGNMQTTFYEHQERCLADLDIEDAGGMLHVFQVLRNAANPDRTDDDHHDHHLTAPLRKQSRIRALARWSILDLLRGSFLGPEHRCERKREEMPERRVLILWLPSGHRLPFLLGSQ